MPLRPPPAPPAAGQLRHNAATALRKEFGIEAVRIILGHRSAMITQVYAEKDEREAINAVRVVG